MPASCAIVPAYRAGETIGLVVDDLTRTLAVPIIVVDDGSADDTGAVAENRGALVLRHDRNRGKGAALRTGLMEAARAGYRVAVTVDADGQHPAASARTVLTASDDPRALVLGVRNLVRDGAPASNRFGNAVSNFFLSLFSGRTLRDTQCGLRRYPVEETLALHVESDGYAFEGEVVLRAIAAKIPLLEVDIAAIYPPERDRKSHFKRFVDPPRIVGRVARTALELRMRGLR